MLENKWSLKDILKFSIRNEALFREELIGSNREWRILIPHSGIALSHGDRHLGLRPQEPVPMTKLGYSTTKAFINAPSSEIQIL